MLPLAHLSTKLIDTRISSDLVRVVLSGQATEDNFERKKVSTITNTTTTKRGSLRGTATMY
jgi:hypothetical protein